jgi:hypothetical protein
MILVVRDIIELFRIIKREKEFYQEILAFLVSYNHWIIKIYSYYPIIDREKTTFYRYVIYTFDFIILDSKEK